MRTLGLFSLILTDIAVSSGLGVGLGYILCKNYQAPWWVLAVSSMVGLCLAFYRLYQRVNKEAE